MTQKIKEKEKAIKLRKKGLSYNDILKEIPVAKSTLSLWLRDVGLSKRQRQKLTEKKLKAMKRGWEARHQEKLNIKKLIIDKAKKEIKKISQRDLWLIGTALYWAEGSKEKDKSSQVTFGNSDPKMVIIFLKWLNKICKIKKKDIIFRVYLHENSENRLKEVKKYWSRIVGFSEKHFKNVSWKRNKISTNRKNIGKKYYGLLSITVRKSTNLNRKIQGWVDGIFNNCRVV